MKLLYATKVTVFFIAGFTTLLSRMLFADNYTEQAVISVEQPLIQVEQEATKAKRPIIRVAMQNYFPMGWRDTDEKFQGRVPIYFEALMAADGHRYQVEYVPCTNLRCIALLKQNRVDMLYAIPMEGMTDTGIPLSNVFPLSIEVWEKKTGSKLQNGGQLKTIVTTMAIEPALDRNEYDILIVNSPALFYPMLEKDRVKGMAASSVVLTAIVELNQLTESDFLIRKVADVPAILWTNKNSHIATDIAYWQGLTEQVYSQHSVVTLNEALLKAITKTYRNK